MQRLRLAVASAALVLAACGGGGDSQVGGALPACAKDFSAVEAPPELPKRFPLPPGLLLRLARYDAPGQISLSGVAPGSLGGVAGFFEEELPARGYRLGRGDEEAGEKEAPFTGNGYRGAWRVNAIAGCEGAVRVGVILLRQG